MNCADIWVTHLASRAEQRLTFCHNAAAGGVAEDPLSAGLPCYVMQEEFNRFTGFWWQPRTPTAPDNLYRSESLSTVPAQHTIRPSCRKMKRLNK